jgi:uncharacterized protein YjdB
VTNTTTVHVHAIVKAVAVQAPQSSTSVGAQVQFSATPTDAHGNPISGRATEWVSSDQAIATIDPNGVATGNKPGTVTIRAVVDSVVGSSSLTVVTSGDDDLSLAPVAPPSAPPANLVPRDAPSDRRYGVDVAAAPRRSYAAGQRR